MVYAQRSVVPTRIRLIIDLSFGNEYRSVKCVDWATLRGRGLKRVEDSANEKGEGIHRGRGLNLRGWEWEGGFLKDI